MGLYARLALKQSCVLCHSSADFCLCPRCEQQLTDHHRRCQCCALKLDSTLDFCAHCLTKAPEFSRVYALYDYNPTCAQLIKQFKFNHQLCIGRYFAEHLATRFAQINQHYDAIIPMPLNPTRLKQRGYNQGLELLRVIKRQNVVIDTQCVQRTKPTQSLSLLSANKRRAEIKGAFSARPVAYQTVLLLDDVMTTGASLNELAKTLKQQGGVKRCDALVVARA